MPFTVTYPKTETGQSELLQALLAPTGSAGWAADATAFGIKRDSGRITAAAVFQHFAGGEAEMHFAILDGAPMTAKHIKALELAAFHPRALALKKVWVPIAESNRSALRAAITAGFAFEHRKRAGSSGMEDAIVLSMTREMAGKVTARPQTMKSAPATRAEGV